MPNLAELPNEQASLLQPAIRLPDDVRWLPSHFLTANTNSELPMHQADHETQSAATLRAPLPRWMPAALAFGLTTLLPSLLLDEPRASANTWSVASLHLDAPAGIHLMRLMLRVVSPAAALFTVWSLTPAGCWIVMTPLALSLLLVENGFFLLHSVNQVSLFVLDGNGVLRQLLQEPAHSIAFGPLAAVIALTGYGTVWHRSAFFLVPGCTVPAASGVRAKSFESTDAETDRRNDCPAIASS